MSDRDVDYAVKWKYELLPHLLVANTLLNFSTQVAFSLPQN